MMHQTEIIKIAQFDGAIEFHSRPTRGNQMPVFLHRKLAAAGLCKKYWPESCTKHFFSVTTCRKHLAQ